MNSNEDRGKRGANIIPSARPSIHDHEDCMFAASTALTMGRFGVDDGVDVVDNAMSKLSEPISPLMFERFRTSPSNPNGRRNSFNNYNKNYTDDDANLLSKSAPATLPSRLRYSDDSEDEETPVKQRVNESFHSSNTSPVKNRNRSASNVSMSNESIRDFAEEKSSRSIKIVLSLISLVVLIASAYMKLYMNIDEANNKVVYDEFNFNTDVVDLGHKYKVDENDVFKVRNGIATIYKKRDVGSFIFAFNSNRVDFDKNAFNKFMNEISFTASKYLRNESTPVHYIMVEGKDLNIMEDHSEVMCKFREGLHKSGVMLVKDIEAFPSRLAMAFHYFCDEYNPLVKKSAIFFTIDLAKCFSKEENKSAEFVTIENCLANKWNSIPPNSIGPLLARVVDVIIDVTSVF